MDTFNINEALDYLKNGLIVVSGKDYFVYKKDRIHCYNNSNHYSLSIEDFISLYKKNIFYFKKEDVIIDETKDEAYYRYYKK